MAARLLVRTAEPGLCFWDPSVNPEDSDLNEHKKPDLSDMFCPVEIGLCFSLS